MYKLNEKEELDREALKVTREYHDGSLDPNNKNHKYEQKLIIKRAREERIKRKRMDRLDYRE